MKFYIDENLMPAMAASLTGIYVGHQFRTPSQEHLLGLEDLELFPDLAVRGYAGIITEDKNQLTNPLEREKLRECGLHWIGIQKVQARGTAQLAAQVAIVAGGLGWVIEATSQVPTAFRLRGPRRYLEWCPDQETL